MAERRRIEAHARARTESQPPTAATRLPTLKTRSASQPAERKEQVQNDEIFSIMVKRQMQMRKDLAQLRTPVALPRLDGKPPPNHQEQAAQLIASMAEAVSNYGQLKRQKGEARSSPDINHWPSLVQQAAAAAVSAQQAESTGAPDMRRGLSKSSLASNSEETHLTPFESVVLERRKARAARAERERERWQEAALPKQDAETIDSARPPTPSYPSPFKEQPAPPPMPPEWSKGLWEQRKRELAEERRKREAERDHGSPPPVPPRVPRGGAPVHGTHRAHVPPEDVPAPWRPWRCPIFPTWTKPEGRPEPVDSPCTGPSAGPPAGRAPWNWGSNLFGSSKVKPLIEAQCEKTARRTQELIAELEAQMAKTRPLPLEERKRVFKDLQRRFHPDKNLLEEESATLAFQHLMDSRHTYLHAA
ncbi:unnamed protein product [Durusdinium trenchii]|uniref:J domain-containing protein n=1 Tax=Durusdinium trenchii TaxID=1381693 RepID=A0ABP0INL7_9DINO